MGTQAEHGDLHILFLIFLSLDIGKEGLSYDQLPVCILEKTLKYLFHLLSASKGTMLPKRVSQSELKEAF